MCVVSCQLALCIYKWASFQDRIGGRIHTFKSGSYVADLGAMVITGLGGNPLSVLKKQLGLQMSKIHRRCPLYFTTGKGCPPPPLLLL